LTISSASTGFGQGVYSKNGQLPQGLAVPASVGRESGNCTQSYPQLDAGPSGSCMPSPLVGSNFMGGSGVGLLEQPGAQIVTAIYQQMQILHTVSTDEENSANQIQHISTAASASPG